LIGPIDRLIEELRRRKVLPTAGIYLAAAFVAMQVVDAVFPYLPLQDPDAAGRLVLAVLTIGFPIALGLAWFLEVTPPQLRLELPREEANGFPPEEPVRKRATELRRDSVAVLPFENLSDDPENAYFSDGITDDIITSVAHIKGLRVLSRTSVMQYKGVNRHASDIGAELGVGTLVMGSVRRSGKRIRIVAEVVDAHNDDHLWTATYDRDLEDIFQVQSEVASKIGHAVQRELSSIDKQRIELRGTSNPEAYDLYLRARFLWNQRTEASSAESVRYFREALALDPDFALAHSGLADAYTILGIYGARAPKEVLEEAKQQAEMALSIDPTLGEAIAAKACVAGVLDWDWDRAERDFQEALELAPSYPTAHQWYAMNVLTPQRRFAEARAQLRRARELDPASSAIAASHGIITFFSGDLEAAASELEVVRKLHPRFALVYSFLGQCYELTGQLERSFHTLREAVELAEDSSETLATLGHALARGGQTAQAEEILGRLDERATKRYVSQVLPALVLIGLGRHDDALDRLDQAARVRASDLIWIRVRPVYTPLADEPRFRAIVDEIGL
jgi:TolB-like protein/Tfp pilus assembly protein PilF